MKATGYMILGSMTFSAVVLALAICTVIAVLVLATHLQYPSPTVRL